jgi:hypothetical protein
MITTYFKTLAKEFAREPATCRPAIRFGLLVFLLVLGLIAGINTAYLPPTTLGRSFGFIVPPSLILNHLAFQFRWTRSVRIGLRVAALASAGLVVGSMLKHLPLLAQAFMNAPSLGR